MNLEVVPSTKKIQPIHLTMLEQRIILLIQRLMQKLEMWDRLPLVDRLEIDFNRPISFTVREALLKAGVIFPP